MCVLESEKSELNDRIIFLDNLYFCSRHFVNSRNPNKILPALPPGYTTLSRLLEINLSMRIPFEMGFTIAAISDLDKPDNFILESAEANQTRNGCIIDLTRIEDTDKQHIDVKLLRQTWIAVEQGGTLTVKYQCHYSLFTEFQKIPKEIFSLLTPDGRLIVKKRRDPDSSSIYVVKNERNPYPKTFLTIEKLPKNYYEKKYESDQKNNEQLESEQDSETSSTPSTELDSDIENQTESPRYRSDQNLSPARRGNASSHLLNSPDPQIAVQSLNVRRSPVVRNVAQSLSDSQTDSDDASDTEDESTSEEIEPEQKINRTENRIGRKCLKNLKCYGTQHFQFKRKNI